MPHILFICTGNTCRSPLAEGLARARCTQAGTTFASAGLGAGHGAPATAESCDQAAERGADLWRHRSRPVSAESLQGADWVIGMTRDHAAEFLARYPDHPGCVGLLGLPGWDLRDVGVPAAAEEVADPYREGTARAYERMAEQVERLLADWTPTFTEAP